MGCTSTVTGRMQFDQDLINNTRKKIETLIKVRKLPTHICSRPLQHAPSLNASFLLLVGAGITGQSARRQAAEPGEMGRPLSECDHSTREVYCGTCMHLVHPA